MAHPSRVLRIEVQRFLCFVPLMDGMIVLRDMREFAQPPRSLRGEDRDWVVSIHSDRPACRRRAPGLPGKRHGLERGIMVGSPATIYTNFRSRSPKSTGMYVKTREKSPLLRRGPVNHFSPPVLHMSMFQYVYSQSFRQVSDELYPRSPR